MLAKPAPHRSQQKLADAVARSRPALRTDLTNTDLRGANLDGAYLGTRGIDQTNIGKARR